MVEATVGVCFGVVGRDAALPYGSASIKALLPRVYEAALFSLGPRFACLDGDDHLWAASWRRGAASWRSGAALPLPPAERGRFASEGAMGSWEAVSLVSG